MNIKTFLLGVIIIVLVVTTIGTVGKDQVEQNDSERITAHGMDESELKTEFNRIASLPYSQCKCREKSDLLCDFIHQHDPYSKVRTISITHESGKYSHVFVEYEGVIFDPTCSPALYRQSWDKYNKNLDIWGFNRKQMISQGYEGVYP
jgi:hypothetical protein